MDGISPIYIGIGALIVLIALIVFAISSRYKIAKSDEAIVITGKKGKPVTNPETGEITTDLSGQKVVISGGTFVVPFIQQADKISLRTRRITLRIEDVLSQNNVLLNIDGVAMVKVGGTENSVRAAAQRFLGQQDAIENFATETLNGSLRSIIGGLTVEQIIRDRAALASAVREEAESSLSNQGLIIDTLQIQSVNDNNGYIHNLSRPEAARADREAKIAEADAKRVAAEKEAQAAESIAVAQKNLAIRNAEIKAETDKELARANAAGPLSKAAQDQLVIESEEAVAERRASLTARELESTVNKPAEAERYRKIQEAEAEKAAAVAKAQAQAEAVKLASAADLERRRNESEAIRLEGQAQADAIRAKGEAEAEALLKKAEAYQEYTDAGMQQSVIDMLPKAIAEISKPLSSIDDLTIISNDGANKMTNTVTDILTQGLEVVKKTTGVDITSMMGKQATKSSNKKASAKSSGSTLVPGTSDTREITSGANSENSSNDF